MKNICFLNSTKFWGGGEKIHLDYAIRFKERGYNVFLAARKGTKLAIQGEKEGLNIFHVSLGNFSFFNPIKHWRLKIFFKRNKIDTVIISSSHDLKTGSFAAKKANVKNICYYRVLAVPIKNSALNRTIFCEKLTHIIANSEETKKTILQHLNGTIDSKNIDIVYQGLDIKAADESQKVKLFEKRNVPTIGNAGRLTEQKGQHHLIRIAEILKRDGYDFQIFIAGTGDLYNQLANEISNKKLNDNIILLGFVEDVNSFMHQIDIFALTSIWEGFGYVIAEAMLAKKPVIAFNKTSNPELITDSKTGYLIDYPDLEEFAKQIKKLIDNPQLSTQLGQNGREILEKKFELKLTIDAFEKALLKS